MYITIQYPLFDNRLLIKDNTRSERPFLNAPQPKDVLRYIGGVIDSKTGSIILENKKEGTKKTKKYFGNWDNPNKYFDASSVLALAGLKANNYYAKLRSASFHTKLLFRRFQADAKFLAKFEMAWSDKVELNLLGGFLIGDHISKYLECAIKIKVGTKHKKEITIADAASHLIYSYFWATQKDKNKSFKDKDVRYQVEYLAPYLVIHSHYNTADWKELGFKEVKLQTQNAGLIKLYYGSIAYKDLNGDTHSIDSWIITSDQLDHCCPRTTPHFIGMPDIMKNLRKNLLHIPSQIYILRKLIDSLDASTFQDGLQTTTVQDAVAKYLHKSIFTLCNTNRNQVDQQEIIKHIYRSFDTEDSMSLKSDYQKAIQWFKFLPDTPSNKNMISQLEGLEFKKKVYISSTLRDLKDYRKIVIELFEKQLRDKFELSYIMEKMFDDGEHELFEDDCIRAVKDSDVYFIILGNRVGSSPKNNPTRTYTEIEYDTAIEYNKKIHLLRLKKFDQIDNQIKHQEILDKFAGRPVNEFEDEKDFKTNVLEILVQY